MKLGTAVNKEVHSIPQEDNTLMVPSARVGIEIELEEWDGVNDTTYWDNHVDDSLRNNGQEFVSRGAGLIGNNISAAVHEFCSLARARGWSEGYPRAGIHIHVDCTDLDLTRGELATFISLYMIMEHALFGYAGEWRRACGFCDALEDSDADFTPLGRAMFDTIGKSLKDILDRENLHKYQAVNLLPLIRFGTIEFRQLPTTFDPARIMEWINIILQLKRATVDFDLSVPLIAQFSKEGARGFCMRVMGSMWDSVAPFYKEDRAWAAIDNAIALMSYAKLIVPKEHAQPLGDRWSPEYKPPVTWVTEKLESIKASNKRKPSAKAKKSETVSIAAIEQTFRPPHRQDEPFRPIVEQAATEAP